MRVQYLVWPREVDPASLYISWLTYPIVIINCLTSSNSRPLQECSPHPEDASRRGEKL